MKADTLTTTHINRIKSQLGLSDNFNIVSIDKKVVSTYDKIGIKAVCEIPEDWYLVTVEDKKYGFKNGFARLQNIEQIIPHH